MSTIRERLECLLLAATDGPESAPWLKRKIQEIVDSIPVVAVADHCQYHERAPQTSASDPCWGDLWECRRCKKRQCAGLGAPDEYSGLCDPCMGRKATEDCIYEERNQVILALAASSMHLGHTVGVGLDPDARDAKWSAVLFIDLPTGQVSWHLPANDRHLLHGLPFYGKPWDRHTNEEKSERLKKWWMSK